MTQLSRPNDGCIHELAVFASDEMPIDEVLVGFAAKDVSAGVQVLEHQDGFELETNDEMFGVNASASISIRPRFVVAGKGTYVKRKIAFRKRPLWKRILSL